MDLVITREKLQEGIAAVIGIVPGRSTLPVLTNLLLETEEDGLRLTATDLDHAVSVRVPAEIEQEGAVLLPGKKLQEIAKALPPAPVSLRHRGETVGVRCGRSFFELLAAPAEDFPTIPRIGYNESQRILAKDLQRMVTMVAFCVSTEETRPILNGVLWTLEAGVMGMAATNGHRLARMRVSVTPEGEMPSPDAWERIVHPKALKHLGKLFAAEDELEVASTENHVFIRAHGAELVTRLIEGPYPNCDSVIPTKQVGELIADRPLVTSSVGRALILAPSEGSRVNLEIGGPMLRLSTRSSRFGGGREELPVEYEREPLEIAFNAEYLLEMVEHVPSDEVRIRFAGPGRAAVLEAVGDDLDDLLLLIAPLRVEE